MRSDWVSPKVLDYIFTALTYQNELAMRVCLATGLRIDDVLSLKTKDLCKGQRFTVKEMKTGKTRRVYLPRDLHDALLCNAGRYYAFEHRTDPKKHRTRQAVWKDIKRAAEAFRIKNAVNITPHTARKAYAVEAFKKYGKPEKVRDLLNHGDLAVTTLYLTAEAITRNKLHGEDPRRGR